MNLVIEYPPLTDITAQYFATKTFRNFCIRSFLLSLKEKENNLFSVLFVAFPTDCHYNKHKPFIGFTSIKYIKYLRRSSKRRNKYYLERYRFDQIEQVRHLYRKKKTMLTQCDEI